MFINGFIKVQQDLWTFCNGEKTSLL